MSLSTFSKLNATIQSVIIFLLVSLPFTYKITNGILGGITGRLADSSGSPTGRGLFIHAIVFGLLIYGLMSL
jgi:hypothetical protein